MDGYARACSLLTPPLRLDAEKLAGRHPEELRLRIGRQPSAVFGGGEHAFSERPVSRDDLHMLLEKITGASLHHVSGMLREGYLSREGLRIGVCGQAFERDGKLSGFQSFSSLAIRIPRENGEGAAELERIYAVQGFRNTLIVSPPGVGKTTALRACIRLLSERGLRVSVIDERNELSATDDGIPQFDLGKQTDVLIGLGKRESLPLLLRGMSPQVIAMDEIITAEDADMLLACHGSGVGLLATAHGESLERCRNRPFLRRLLGERVFAHVLVISMQSGKRRYELCAAP